MEKLDLKKQFKHLYQPSAKQVELVDVPDLAFAVVAGRVQPGETPGTSPAFQEAVETLYGISYTLKFQSKKDTSAPLDYAVMPLESLWWIEDGVFELEQPGNWHWRAMIHQPEHITEEMFASGLAQLRKKKPGPGLDRLRFERFHEGLCLQLLHIGPYSTEPASIERMHAFARENNLRLKEGHHEIYLGDPRKADPESLKTILRLPVERAAQPLEKQP